MSMLKWCAGAAPGKVPKRPARTSEEVVQSKKKYEEKRTRNFKASWQKGRPWLTCEGNIMRCLYCIKTGQSSKFTTGTDNLRLDTVQAHELSKPHVKAAAVCERAPVAQSQAAKVLHKLKQHEYDRLVIQFRNAHAVAKHHMSYKTYTWLCQLDKAKGLDVGENYQNDKKAREFVKHIAKVAMDGTKALIMNNSFFSATCDGSTDFMGDDLETLYLRTSSHGNICEKFLIIKSANSSTGVDIYNFVMETLDGYVGRESWRKKLVGFAADGASNMQG